MFKPIKSCIFAGALACALTGTVLAAGPLKPVDNPAPIAAKGIGQTQALNAVKTVLSVRMATSLSSPIRADLALRNSKLSLMSYTKAPKLP